MEDYVYEKIKMMVGEREGKVEPSHILRQDLMRELNNDINDTLNKLYAQGKISATKTLNDIAINIKN